MVQEPPAGKRDSPLEDMFIESLTARLFHFPLGFLDVRPEVELHF